MFRVVGEEALKIIVLHLKNLEFQADDAYISLVNQHSGRMPIPEFKQAFIVRRSLVSMF